MDEQARRARQEMKKLPLKEKLKNFWYYYRIHCIVLLFAGLVLIWSAVQCANTVNYDMEISYYGGNYIADERIDEFENVLKQYTADINGDGMANVSVLQTVADITGDYIDMQGKAALERMQLEIATNECPAYIVDETFKDIFLKNANEAVLEIIDLSQSPEISQMLGLDSQDGLYWIMMTEYETAKDDEQLLAERSCAIKVTEFLKKETE